MRTRTLICAALLCVAFAASASAASFDAPAVPVSALEALPGVLQAPPPVATGTSRYGWDEAGPDLASVQAYIYRIYADGATTGTIVTATCAGTVSPYQCTAPIGAFTQGTHSAKLSAANAGGESAQSAAATFTFVVIAATPSNFGIR